MKYLSLLALVLFFCLTVHPIVSGAHSGSDDKECKECNRQRKAIYDQNGDFYIWDCSHSGKNCEVPEVE